MSPNGPGITPAPCGYYAGFEQCPDRLNYVRYIRRNGTSIVFFGLDSNEYSPGNVARGVIDDSRLAWLAKTFAEIEANGLISGNDSLDPHEFESAVRCLILHHHPVSLQKGLRGLSRLTHRFTLLEGAERLLNLVKGRIDVVFHGHEHFPVCFRHSESGIVIVSAGTLSEWTSKRRKNSFYVIMLYSDYSVNVHEYLWTGSEFQSRQTLSDQEPATFKLKGRVG
jgi:3',5'-cyclic AMP phosphodiesterase CpdA